ncbi:haloacid dehalogenase-like hydrolase [Amycolatopsis magusensis]|uniref:Phosphoglycolate phosphatase-like HAD superfamily hydrolase n=1 Tax=Amycolatopsis magusensis TaxID=882444 RepID=A0ABS4PVE0_9PSEU|nr:haloacid dehalogenase-like hydrolase [Amycolatopsis magusensis]MBP2182870.1 phosphoglycolate phosphatase-like HAD superfamily hydrolase [Amycolatopsis magusensis]
MTAPTAPPQTLLLWDIDHTLIETRGVGRAIYDRAFPAATGRPLAKLASISGRTELDIMRESLRVNGIEPTEAMVNRLAAALTEGYEDAREELATVGRALPGAEETLAELARNPTVHQAVLSGNLRSVSRIKLEVFGLKRFLDLDSSAYGDDHVSRPELVKIAQGRARERIGGRFDNADTVLIGDTPNDVQAALTAGVRIVAVATGKSSMDELRDAGATVVLPELTGAAAPLFG